LVVTLFYLLRLRRRRVEVPFGPLWEKALNEKQSSSLFKVLKRIFSLLLQLLFVALIVTAIADPRWTGESGVEFRPAPKASASHTLLVVDRSASMSATDVPGGRFAAAIQAAHKVIAGIRPGEEIMLASVGRDFSVVSEWTHDKKHLKNLINELQVEDSGTSIDAMQRFCTNAFQALSNPRLVFITDGAFKEQNPDALNNIDYKVVDVGSKMAPSNVAVLDFSVRAHLGNALKYALYYRLKNVGDRAVKVSAYLYSDPAGKAKTRADFARLAPAMAPMIHHLEAELEGSRAALIIRSDNQGAADLFAADDAAFAVVPKRRMVRVQLVGPANLFLEAALQTRSHVEVSSRSESEFKTLKGFDLTVFNGVAPRVEETGNRIY
ncbi:MAG TPA: VWA domain-containing protein, partial [Myxococcales bacterium]|nr:VWA domain-containing protein [Myxococcales bacterium]